jgi:hypothetical protein
VETEWLRDEILAGLQKLYCLGLDRTPAAEILQGTAEAWVEAITTGRVFDRQLDTPRLRKAFVNLAGNRTSWPAPAHFVEAMPPREQLALTKQPIPADPERAAAAIAEVERMLRS